MVAKLLKNSNKSLGRRYHELCSLSVGRGFDNLCNDLCDHVRLPFSDVKRDAVHQSRSRFLPVGHRGRLHLKKHTVVDYVHPKRLTGIGQLIGKAVWVCGQVHRDGGSAVDGDVIVVAVEGQVDCGGKVGVGPHPASPCVVVTM